MKTLQKLSFLTLLFVVSINAQTVTVESTSNESAGLIIYDGVINGSISVNGGEVNENNLAFKDVSQFNDVLKNNVTGSTSYVMTTELSDGRILFSGEPNSKEGTDFQSRIVSYSENDLVNPEKIITVRNLSGGGKIRSFARSGNLIYFSVSGVNTSSFIEETYNSSSTISLSGLSYNMIARYNLDTGNLVQSYTSQNIFLKKGMCLNPNGDLYQMSYTAANQATISHYNSNMGFIGSTSFSVDQLDSQGNYDLLATNDAILTVAKSGSTKGLRKFSFNLVEDTQFFDRTNAHYITPYGANKIVETPDYYLVLGNYVGSVTAYDKSTGNAVFYKRISLANSSGTYAWGLWLRDMYYDESTAKILLTGNYSTADDGGVSLDGYTLPTTTSTGSRTIDMNMGTNIDAGAQLKLTSIPSGMTVNQVGNTFWIDGSSSFNWASVQVTAGFVNPGYGFQILHGDTTGNTATFNLTDETLDYFLAIKYIGDQLSYMAWYPVRKGTGLGVQDLPAFEKSPYPNPTTGTVHVDPQYEDFTFEVFDMTGRKLGGEKSSIELSPYPSGIYMVVPTSPDGQRYQTLKIIKQ